MRELPVAQAIMTDDFISPPLSARVEGAYCVRVTVKDRTNLAAVGSSVLMYLQSQGVIENDKLCQEITVRRGKVRDGFGMSVLVATTKDRVEEA